MNRDGMTSSECEHEWHPCGYVLSYEPGGRRYTVLCRICGAEGDREECEPGFSNRDQARRDHFVEATKGRL